MFSIETKITLEIQVYTKTRQKRINFGSVGGSSSKLFMTRFSIRGVPKDIDPPFVLGEKEFEISNVGFLAKEEQTKVSVKAEMTLFVRSFGKLRKTVANRIGAHQNNFLIQVKRLTTRISRRAK